MALILSRKISETVLLIDKATGREIGRVFVSEFRGDKVRLGFMAGDDVVFVRGELHVQGFEKGKSKEGINDVIQESDEREVKVEARD